jgi:hypothetical protein
MNLIVRISKKFIALFSIFLFIIIGCKKEKSSIRNRVLTKEIEVQDSTNFSYFQNHSTDYLIQNIDINKDCVLDKIVSSKPYKGNKLYFFVKNSEEYKKVLESVNFSEDGGNIIKGIYPTNENDDVLILHTIFPDGGNLQAFHYVEYKRPNTWILNKTVFETTYWQDSKTYVCDIVQNINLKEFVSGKGFKDLKHLPEHIDNKVCNEIQKNDTIYIEGENLIISKNSKKNVYEDLITNAISLTTSLKLLNKNEFYLIYEYNGAVTKMQHAYKYNYSDESSKLFLLSKEVIKKDKENIGAYKISFKKFVIKNQTFDDLELIADSLQVKYSKSSENAKTYLYNNEGEEVGVLNYNLSNLERYINFPLYKQSLMSSFNLSNNFIAIVEKENISLKYQNDEVISNENIIRNKDENKTCMSDGFITIINKDNYFTIEQQNCNNKQIINEYITFKFEGKQYLLHKLGFEFIDKSDPNNQETIVFTNEDFGIIPFSNVNLEDLSFKLFQ